MDCDGVSNDSDEDADGDEVNAYDTDGGPCSTVMMQCCLGLVSEDLDCDGT